jgi:uncharacterized membrane protein
MLSRVKGIILFVSLLYLTFYVPMSLTFYSPVWMKLNCGFHGRCEAVGESEAYEAISELSAYFRHQGELESFYTQKEKLHLKEVRGIFDKLLALAISAAVLLALTFDKRRASRFALVNAVIILTLLLVLPFFGTFWRNIFHPLLFDNDMWMNNRYDLSFYIMPRQFFKYTVGMLTGLCFLINIAIWLRFRKKNAER